MAWNSIQILTFNSAWTVQHQRINEARRCSIIGCLDPPKNNTTGPHFLNTRSVWLIRILYFCGGCIGGGYCKGVIVREEERSLTGFHTLYTY